MSTRESEWSDADEVHRLNHVAGVIFEGSLALAAAAAVTAFTFKSGTTQKLAFVIAALAALPGWGAAWTLRENPLRLPTAERASALEKQADHVDRALLSLLVAAPMVAVLVLSAVFYPSAVLEAGLVATAVAFASISARRSRRSQR
jgi:hypothetical protein